MDFQPTTIANTTYDCLKKIKRFQRSISVLPPSTAEIAKKVSDSLKSLSCMRQVF